MNTNSLKDLAAWHDGAGPTGLPSVCSAHPMVLEAAMRATAPTALPLLIEATCNQVNQDGGYTGMTPPDFRAFVERIADDTGFPRERLIFGGDHLGPNPWKALPAAEAMAKAEAMVRAFAAAGFTKLHLDCSMGCAGEPVALADAETAQRAARLAAAVEAALPGGDIPKPVYIIGTEVPVPGGALSDIDELKVTAPEDALSTYRTTRDIFHNAGQAAAFERVVAIVVQPGVEFSNDKVDDYDPAKTPALTASLAQMPGLVFECHSTDYQTRANLTALVANKFSILKVGPGLTFRLREALYGLDVIAEALFPDRRATTLRATMERIMLVAPENWEKYYPGTPLEQATQRHFSYSDRIRYYWPHPEARAAVAELFALLDGVDIPEPLISQHLGARYADIRAGALAPRAHALVVAAVVDMMEDYICSCL